MNSIMTLSWLMLLVIGNQVIKTLSDKLCRTTGALPLVLNTWPFSNATYTAWNVLNQGGSALDAVEKGCMQCEIDQCDGTVGYGGRPNEDGETTLDAMIMDGITHNVGAVGCLKRVKSAISVARKVMEHTEHTFLVGSDATRFAVEMGFKEESLQTNSSWESWKEWKKAKCQPNAWKDVVPDPSSSCGPYHPPENPLPSVQEVRKSPEGHDTIGMLVVDRNGDIAAGTSTNGRAFKIPGRVGDSPIAGSGSYVDNDIGAAAATGDGDVMMRFLPSLQAVMNLQLGMEPKAAAENALRKITKFYPKFEGAVVVASKSGEYGAAVYGYTFFKYCVINPSTGRVQVIPVDPIQ